MRKGDTYYRDILTTEDITKILEAAVPYETEHLFLRLLARTGRRMGEIREITPRDIDIKIGASGLISRRAGPKNRSGVRSSSMKRL